MEKMEQNQGFDVRAEIAFLRQQVKQTGFETSESDEFEKILNDLEAGHITESEAFAKAKMVEGSRNDYH